jgi:hypothetical protein
MLSSAAYLAPPDDRRQASPRAPFPDTPWQNAGAFEFQGDGRGADLMRRGEENDRSESPVRLRQMYWNNKTGAHLQIKCLRFV